MGGKSKSSSKSSNSTETNNTDNRIGAADGGQVATDGGTIINESLDFEFVEEGLEQIFGFGEQNLSLVNDALDLVEGLKAQEFENAAALKSNFDLVVKGGIAIAIIAVGARILK